MNRSATAVRLHRFARAALVAALLAHPVAHAASPVVQMRNDAKAAFREGDYEKAVRLYKEITALEPERLSVLKEAMWALWNMGRFQAAKEIADSVIAIEPEDFEAAKILSWAPAAMNREKVQGLQASAKAAYRKGDFAGAAAAYEAISQIDPNNVTLMRERMWILANMKRTGEATAVARRLLKLRPGDREAETVIERAANPSARASSESLPEAIQALRRRIAQDPADGDAVRRLGWALFNAGRGAEAEAVLRKYLGANDDNPDAWAQLGKIKQSRGDYSGSIDAFSKSLEINPEQAGVLAAMGKSYFGVRDLDTGVRYFEQAVDMGGKTGRDLLPVLAKTLFFRGEYRRAAETWAQAVKAFPDRPTYRYFEAEASFYAGNQGMALQRLHELRRTLKEPFAYNFLIDNAEARGDIGEALQLLEEKLKTLEIEDGRRVIRAANLYAKMGRPDDGIRVLRRWTDFAPRDVWALLTLGVIQKSARLYEDAAETYQRALDLNPWIVEAQLGMAECAAELRDVKRAVQWTQKAYEFDPTDPWVMREHARSLFEAGDRQKGRQMLLDWVKVNGGTTVMPILLYHGLTPIDSSPMLAYRIHTTIKSFDNQLRALREAGFEPVTMKQVADWHAGKPGLPEKPILIAFDDARMDSFRFGDPILARHGYKATMFVPLDDVESYGSVGYANWSLIREFQATGRWEIESHGGHAHSRVPVDAKGRRMLYLIQPRWIEKLGRTESEAQWVDRIHEDHKLIKSKLLEHTGSDALALAWPEGQFGQHSDHSMSVPNNMSAVRKHFRFAFVQNEAGLNVRSQDPHFLHRFEPPKEMSGEDLVAHISNKNPIVAIYRDLLYMALEDRKIGEARGWLKRLKLAGVTPGLYMSEKARIDYASGNASEAYQLALQSFTTEPTLEARRLLSGFKSKSGIGWNPGFSFQSDSQDRESWAFDQELEIPFGSSVRGRIHQGIAGYREDAVETIKSNTLGAGFSVSWGDGNYFGVLGKQYSLSGQADDMFGYSGSYRHRWTEHLWTRFDARRGLYGSARAIVQDVRENRYRGAIRFGQAEDWGVLMRGRLSDITGDNERRTGEFEAGWPLFRSVEIGPLYRFVYDDMKNVDPRYYSPNKLQVHELGPQWTISRGRRVQLTARYLPGYAKEEGIDGEFVQSADLRVRWEASPTVSITPAFSYEETGNYFYNLSSVEVEVRF